MRTSLAGAVTHRAERQSRAAGSHDVNREPGWYGDPYFRTQERYWDGEAWTDQTRDTAGGTAAAAAATTSTGSSGSAASPAGPAHPARGHRLGHAGGDADDASVTRPEPQDARSGSGVSDAEAGRTIPLGIITSSGPPTAAPGHGGSGRRRGLVIAVVAAIVVLAAVGVGFIVSGGGGSGGSSGHGGGGGGTASATGVAGAVQKTLHAGTVDAAVDVKVSTASGSRSSRSSREPVVSSSTTEPGRCR